MAKAALRLISQRDAAKYLGIAVRTLRNWDKNPAQAPPRRKVGKRYYYQIASLNTWLAEAPPAVEPKPRPYRERTGLMGAAQMLAKS